MDRDIVYSCWHLGIIDGMTRDAVLEELDDALWDQIEAEKLRSEAPASIKPHSGPGKGSISEA